MSERSYTTKDKLIWGMASFGLSLVAGVYAAMLQYFYQVYLGLDAIWIAIAAIIYAVWNAVNDPLFGVISDKTKGKRGRRIPYMRFTAPFLGLTFILIWFVPVTAGEEMIFWWMLITMLGFDTTYTIIGLAYFAFLPELSDSDSERGDFQKYASIFFLLGLILGFLLPDMLRPKVGSTSLTPLYIGMVVIGIVGAVSVLVTTYNFTERPEFTQVDEPLGFIDSIKYTFKSKSFLVVTFANFMTIFVQAVLIGGMFYLADYVLHVPMILPLVAIFLGLLIGVFFANVLATKFGFVRALQYLLLLSGIPLMLMPFVPELMIYLCLLFAGFGLSGPLVLTNVLFAQVTDEDEIISGVRREASFFGVNAMITKPAQSVALAMAPILLEIAGFLVPRPGGAIIVNQPASVVLMIKIIIGFIPGVTMLLGALILQLYPLKGSYLKEIQDKVEIIHKEKHLKLKEDSK